MEIQEEISKMIEDLIKDNLIKDNLIKDNLVKDNLDIIGIIKDQIRWSKEITILEDHKIKEVKKEEDTQI